MRTRLLTFVALVTVACGGTENQCNVPEVPVVTATLSSVTLAQDCGAGAAAPKQSADFVSGVCANADSACPSLCRQSSMQIAYGNSGPDGVTTEIREVRLLDPTTGVVLERLSWREPQQWSLDRYVGWNEKLRAGELKASYKLSAPTYSNGTARLAWDAKYKVEVDVAIDGEVRTLTGEATREPEVVT